MRELPMINERAALDLVVSLLKVPGRSREEGRIQQTIRGVLKDAGVPDASISNDTAHRQSGGGEVGNLIVKLPGTRRGPRRLLMAHVDTVPICVGADPVIDGEVIRSRNKTTGLGGDDRGGVGVCLTVLRELLRQGLPHPPLTLFFPVQEEIGLYGARYCSLNKLGKPAFGFNWDGSEPETVCIGATGDYAIEVEIHGHPSHAGVHPELGVSATVIASLAIADLVANGWHGLIRKGRNAGTSNVGIVHAGEATNVVTPHLSLRAEARSHDPVFRKKIVEAYRKAFAAAAKTVKSADGKVGRVEFSADLKYESFRMPVDAVPVQLAQQAVRAFGMTPDVCIGNGGLDANWMFAHGVPTVTLGCGQQDIHTTNETLRIADYLQACRVGLVLATAD
jgi:tripeptide aminopeptidase